MTQKGRKPKSLALLVGLRKVNKDKYDGWAGVSGCWGCELDVDNVERILAPLGYQSTILKTAQATRRKVLDGLAQATKLRSGDIFVFYYSGHGGQQPDQSGPKKDELDGQDETLVLYDGELRDDSLNDVWMSIKPGVRVVMVSDSCNSGSNYKNLGRTRVATPIVPLDTKVARSMRAQMIHMGGCRDSKTSTGYSSGSLFTKAFCDVYGSGLRKPYKSFYDEVYKLVVAEEPGQQPAYNEYGPVRARFRNQRPFAI